MSIFNRSRILRDGGWVALGQVLSAAAALISIRIMTELLSPEEFGRLTLLVGAAALALGLVSTPRLQAVIRFYPECSKNERLWILRRAAGSLIYSLVMVAALLISLGGGIISVVSDQLWHIGLLIAAMLVIDSLYAFEQAFLNAARRQRAAAIVQTANAWSRPLMAICSAWLFGYNAEAALAGYIVGSGLILIASRCLVRFEGSLPEPRIITPSESEAQIELSTAIKRYALPLAPLAVFGWLSGMGDRYIIAGILSLSEVGLYAAVYGLASRPFLMLSTIIEQTLRPILQNAIADGSNKEIDIAKRRMLITSSIGATVGVTAFVFLKDPVGYVFLAEEYRSAIDLMPWIALGYALLCISSIFTRFCYAFDATRYVLALTVSGSLIGIAVLIPAAIFYGLHGAVLAVPVRFGIELALSKLLSRKAERRYIIAQRRTHESA
ncbi:lipopolysaccharide biosynthesis protein [Marinobacter changyiensis]|uniref:lipopolysaccharide biosynthesis protein n=1 Tax=Marinobacter changyiensis TaxID=2604091 RepID=UPI001264E579|nr:lipopolysaccharide biosynthesis protein [Marinobacter changyiensis]